MVRNVVTRHRMVLALLGVLAGCQLTPLDPNRPSVPLPTYSVGDRFTFDNGRTDRVVSVDGDWVDWRRSNGFRWTANRDFVAPTREWQSKTRTGGLDSSTGPAGSIWPLQPGRALGFFYTGRSALRDGGDEKTYNYRWHCEVGDKETVTVPAGTFETTPISCDRYAERSGRYYGTRTWHYAPRVGHYVLYIDKSYSRGTTTKALKSYRLKLPKLGRAQRVFYNAQLQTALQTVRSGAAHTARGAGLRVVIMPLRTYKIASGRYCRDYRRTIVLAERDYGARGTSCRMKNGWWRPRRLARR